MRALTVAAFAFASVLNLGGCATNLITMQQAQQQSVDMPDPLRSKGMAASHTEVATAVTPVLIPPANSYQPRYTHKTIDDYAEQITMQLMQQARHLDGNSRIGVASFVSLDASLQKTNALGNQLAESFIKEVQAYGISVVDYKIMKNIDVSRDGDIIFSRDNWQLSGADMDYVLSGTMHRDEKGVRVNARIISLGNKSVVASARGFIPHFVVNAVVPEYVFIPAE
ncbi:hypothetical protein KIH87_12355 [Paraneptunicella aestuarii]|uniref:FlgO family outer membrane protein n=1 Tax=Paraneptunicella aestuarii TaxID=2831148 RepID=UPI001E3D11C7|nr:FlgO family outer membrane protein [Paraneptunicella aestuarii]UAA37504.1 hypothetical protein KIH87_12355 [Paraneptunicella aestuarii]